MRARRILPTTLGLVLALADRYGFIVIYPTATQHVPDTPNCFDTWSDASKHREAYSIEGAGHHLPQTGMAAYPITFFGLG
jgi:poly(3-hydroxybutyrate) depolymerase